MERANCQLRLQNNTLHLHFSPHVRTLEASIVFAFDMSGVKESRFSQLALIFAAEKRIKGENAAPKFAFENFSISASRALPH
jgi:hypothetical protein